MVLTKLENSVKKNIETVICRHVFSFSVFKVLLIENKEESLLRAQSRSAELGLKNIGFIQANLDYFTGPFQIGVSKAIQEASVLM